MILAEGSHISSSLAVRRQTDHALLVQVVRKPAIASGVTG